MLSKQVKLAKIFLNLCTQYLSKQHCNSQHKLSDILFQQLVLI